MDKETLSRLFAQSTAEMTKVVVEMYESLHDELGDPLADWDLVLEEARECKKLVLEELEAIKAAVKEYNEELSDADS